MEEKTTPHPLERILSPAGRRRLDEPFRANSQLRARTFPGAGQQIPKQRLLEAYVKNYTSSDTDWLLLAHGTWTWIEGHASDLATLLADLKTVHESGAAPELKPGVRKDVVRRFTEEGAEEIDVFFRIFGNANADYRKAVLEFLEKQEPTPDRPAPERAPAATRNRAAAPGARPESAQDLDPLTRTRLALIGSLFFFLLSLIPVAVQYWRLPGESHEIVLGIAGLFAVLTVAAGIDFWLKRR